MQNDVFLGKDEGQLSTGGPAARATGNVGRTNQQLQQKDTNWNFESEI